MSPVPSALAIGDLLPASVQDRVSEPQVAVLPVAVATEVAPVEATPTPEIEEAFAESAPAAIAESAAEAIADAAPEAIVEFAPEAVADHAPEAVADFVPEAAVEFAPEPVELDAVAPEVESLEADLPDIELRDEIESAHASIASTEPTEFLGFGSVVEPEAEATVTSWQADDAADVVENVASLGGLEVASWEAPQAPQESVIGEVEAGPVTELAEPAAAAAVPVEWASLPDEGDDAQLEEPDLAEETEPGVPLDLSPFDHGTGERLSVVIESAPETLDALVVETDTQAAALEVLEQVARRVRSGELRVAPSGASAESVLASILAALLSPRS
ncbi:MAG: hypothetical protein JNJ98_09070 [Gemmatimonadetes bacterium]|nr:hypothetical protein [Gemmatimonadota bacterium]